MLLTDISSHDIEWKGHVFIVQEKKYCYILAALVNNSRIFALGMQKELGQKDRLLQQQQFKLDEALRKVADSNSQQVWPSSKYKPHALWNLRQISTSFSWCYLSLCNPQADLQREPEHKQRFFQELTDRAEEEVRPKQWTDTFNMLFKQLVALRFFFFFFLVSATWISEQRLHRSCSARAQHSTITQRSEYPSESCSQQSKKQTNISSNPSVFRCFIL